MRAVSQAVTPILSVGGQAGDVHAKIITPDIDNGRVNLVAIDGQRAEHGSSLAGNGAGCQADNGDALDLGRLEGGGVEKWTDQELLPGTAIVQDRGMPDGVNALTSFRRR